jgi:GTP-binding protein
MKIENVNKTFAFNNCHFLRGVQDMKDLPVDNIPEVAFIGRSNVGKSSLINKLFRSNSLTRVAKYPGRTQQINLFTVGKNLFRVVDLPGYGYARVAKTQVESWQDLVWQYLTTRQNLIKLWLLIDARRGIMNIDSETMRAMSSSGVGFHLVLSKVDKLSVNKLQDVVNATQNSVVHFPSMFPSIITASSMKERGTEEMRRSILDCVRHSSR